MKASFFIFCSFCLLTTSAIAIADDTATIGQGELPDTIGSVGRSQSLNALLLMASRSSGVVFCRETVGGRSDSEAVIGRFESDMPGNVKDRSSLSGASVAEFITALEHEGFVCTRKGRVVVIADAVVAEIHDNPLDRRIPGFVFKGTHTDFLRKLASASGELGPATVRSARMPPDAVYDITIRNEVSVRDVLMYVSSKYGMQWSVSHLTDATSPATRTDGLSLSRWLFLLQGYVPEGNQAALPPK